MLNIRGLANSVVQIANPDIIGNVQVSTGTYATQPDGTRVPQYATYFNVPMQVQALPAAQVALIDGLNIQAVNRSVYMNGNIEGLDRFAGKGGDVLTFNGQEWLVSAVLETWDVAGWCKVAVTLQNPALPTIQQQTA